MLTSLHSLCLHSLWIDVEKTFISLLPSALLVTLSATEWDNSLHSLIAALLIGSRYEIISYKTYNEQIQIICCNLIISCLVLSSSKIKIITFINRCFWMNIDTLRANKLKYITHLAYQTNWKNTKKIAYETALHKKMLKMI